MGLPAFVNELFQSGRVRVSGIYQLGDEELQECEAILRSIEESVRLELAGEAPPFSPPAALWAATRLFRGAQALVYRELDGEELTRMFSDACHDPPNPATHYSVDLTLRYLPDLLAQARRTAQRDALVERLQALAADWPLSSVGTGSVSGRDLRPILGHPGLFQLYTDRIIQRRDHSRLSEPRVREAVRQALGAFPELAPDIARTLRSDSLETTSGS